MTFDPSSLQNYPNLPGVYLMKNEKEEVLYVGKAKNLRLRIKQYFIAGGDGREMIPFLVSGVDHVETIVVSSEKEALLLENTLIKKYKPKYNALLKDDKTFIALKVNTRNKWPMVSIVRYRGKPKPDGQYFGPYTGAYSARQTLDLLQKIFPMRQCSDQELIRRTRPCILYDMKRCIAPCVEKCTKQEYDDLVDHTIKFLRGQDKEVLKDLYHEMEAASEKLEFERASMLYKTIQQIEKTMENQKVDKPFGDDMDVLGIYRQGDEVILSQMIIRNGRLEGNKNHNFNKIAEDDAELLQSFLLQNYHDHPAIPHEILVPIPIESKDAMEEILSMDQKRSVEIVVPQKGQKKELIEMARVNAETAFKQTKDAVALKEKILLEMQDKLSLTRYPKRIECFDNSSLSGDEPVSVMVAFTEGVKDSNRYRKYKLKTIDPNDDYGSMKEVLSRRYKRAKEEGDLPDLLIVDGGKGHLNMAHRVLEELEIATVDVIGIAKEEGRHDKGMTSEQVYLLNLKDPVFLQRHSNILFLLQQIRDEAHRFAITFQRKRRNKKSMKSALEDIPGIGPVKQKALLRHFGSLKRILEASPEDLKQVKGITQANVEAIKALKFRI